MKKDSVVLISGILSPPQEAEYGTCKSCAKSKYNIHYPSKRFYFSFVVNLVIVFISRRHSQLYFNILLHTNHQQHSLLMQIYEFILKLQRKW